MRGRRQGAVRRRRRHFRRRADAGAGLRGGGCAPAGVCLCPSAASAIGWGPRPVGRYGPPWLPRPARETRAHRLCWPARAPRRVPDTSGEGRRDSESRRDDSDSTSRPRTAVRAPCAPRTPDYASGCRMRRVGAAQSLAAGFACPHHSHVWPRLRPHPGTIAGESPDPHIRGNCQPARMTVRPHAVMDSRFLGRAISCS